MATREERAAPLTCCCGDPVRDGELMSDLTVAGQRWRGHYACVRARLTPAQVLKAVELDLLPLLPDDKFIGRKLLKFAQEQTGDRAQRRQAILDFMTTIEEAGGPPPGP